MIFLNHKNEKMEASSKVGHILWMIFFNFLTNSIKNLSISFNS